MTDRPTKRPGGWNYQQTLIVFVLAAFVFMWFLGAWHTLR